MVGMGRSTEENLKAEIADLKGRLQESVRRLEETQALARVGSWEWDISSLSSIWSGEMLRIFGRDPDGSPPTLDELIAAVHPDDKAGFQELVARVRQTPGPFHHSYRIVDLDGDVHYLQARGHTDDDASGKPVRAYGTTQDISELKRSEAKLKQAQRLEAVGQLSSGVAHDFNNLLAVILNQAECLIADAGDAGNLEATEGLREIERAALTAAELTRHLLLFSRREATDLCPVDLGVVLAEAETLLRSAVGEQLELSIEVEPGLPAVALGAGQAEQVLINLAVNARDAMPDGGRIVISARCPGSGSSNDPQASGPAGNSPHLILSVADEGIGMSPDTVAQAFDPFFTTKPRDRGTGLGLATVYGIVSHAGGQVDIQSEPGKGTVVTICLPTLAAGEETPRLGQAVGAPARGEKVLVVDDEEAVRTIVCRMLDRHGYRTVAAADGAEAEAVLIEEGDVDLLLTDVVMPGMSGWELVGRLHSRNPGLRAIYMSANIAAGSSTGRALGEGAIVLEKPFTGTQLVAAVGELLTRGRDASAV
jgi:two-component system, cell cycle sensor histidine kinase and response regulator CckA